MHYSETYYPEQEQTEERLAAWEADESAFEEALDTLRAAIEEGNESAADEALDTMRGLEKPWGDCPTTDRAAEIVGRIFAGGAS